MIKHETRSRFKCLACFATFFDEIKMIAQIFEVGQFSKLFIALFSITIGPAFRASSTFVGGYHALIQGPQ